MFVSEHLHGSAGGINDERAGRSSSKVAAITAPLLVGPEDKTLSDSAFIFVNILI